MARTKDEKKKAPMHQGHRQRLKSLAVAEGLSSFSSFQVLELLLFYALPYQDTNPLAHKLLERYGDLRGVFSADYHDLLRTEGIGANAATLLALVPELSRRYQNEMLGKRIHITDREALKQYLINLFIGHEYEMFYLVCLDINNNVIRSVPISKGTLNQVAVYPRLVVEAALRHQARSVLLAHNHPSGSLRPSHEDLSLTQRVNSVLSELDIKVLDHYIVSGDQCFSFMDRGLVIDE